MGPPILVKNKLEIQPGNTIKIPGCEPTTSISSLGLLKNFNCKTSNIPVKDVLKLIPGAKIIFLTTPVGQNGTGRWLELPSGPPPDGEVCPHDCGVDWYGLLKTLVPEEPEECDTKCAGFNFTGCSGPKDDDYVRPYRRVADPDMRPNGDPL